MKEGPHEKIKKGQVWKRRSDGLLILITQAGDKPRTKNLLKPHIQHHIKRRDLWVYWELLGTENSYELT